DLRRRRQNRESEGNEMGAYGFEGLAGSRISPAVQELKDVHPAPLRRGVLFGAPGNKKPRLGGAPPLPPTKAAYSLLLFRSARSYLHHGAAPHSGPGLATARRGTARHGEVILAK